MEGKGKRGPRLAALAPDQGPEIEGSGEAVAPAPGEDVARPGGTPARTESRPAGAAATPEPSGDDALTALAHSQAALAQGLQALGSEMAGLAQSEFDNAAQAAREILGAKTFTDAFEINTGFTSRSLETLVAGSARLSELGVKLAAETTEPILAQFGRSWTKAVHSGGY